MEKESLFRFSIKDIAEIGIFLAIAIILDMPFCKIKVVANGGSISLSTLPLLIIALRKGPFKGFVASGILFGLMTCLIDGYGFITYPLDYLLGFGSMATIGFFQKFIIQKEKKLTFIGVLFLVISILVSWSLRLVFSTISGILIYELDFISSLIYQLTYMVPSFVAVLVVMLILYKPILSLSQHF